MTRLSRASMEKQMLNGDDDDDDDIYIYIYISSSYIYDIYDDDIYDIYIYIYIYIYRVAQKKWDPTYKNTHISAICPDFATQFLGLIRHQ